MIRIIIEDGNRVSWPVPLILNWREWGRVRNRLPTGIPSFSFRGKIVIFESNKTP